MATSNGPGMVKWLWISAVVLVVGIAAWVLTPTPTENEMPQTEGASLVGGPFSLLDQDGERVTDQTFLGQYMLIYFGFTHCPDVCPVDLQSMAEALDMVDDRTLSRIQPVFVTVDPERDTVEEVKAFVEHFHPRLIGLTGTQEEINDITKAYRVYHRKVEQDGAADYLVDHSAIAFLMNPEGEYVAHFSSGFSPSGMANRLNEIVGGS